MRLGSRKDGPNIGKSSLSGQGTVGRSERKGGTEWDSGLWALQMNCHYGRATLLHSRASSGLLNLVKGKGRLNSEEEWPKLWGHCLSQKSRHAHNSSAAICPGPSNTADPQVLSSAWHMLTTTTITLSNTSLERRAAKSARLRIFSYKSIWSSPKRAVYIIKFRRNYNWMDAKASLFSPLPREQGFGEKI